MVNRSLLALTAVLMLAVALAPVAAADPVSPPSPPMNVEATVTADGVELTWDPPLFDGGSPVTYRVYRDSVLVADGLTQTSYLDALPMGAASASSSATYAVSAANNAGESAHATTCIYLTVIPPLDVMGCVDLVVAVALWVVDQVTP